MVTHQDRQVYKQILLQSNVHRVNYSPSGKIKQRKVLNIHGLFRNYLKDKVSSLGIVEVIIMSLGKVYYDPKHPAKRHIINLL